MATAMTFTAAGRGIEVPPTDQLRPEISTTTDIERLKPAWQALGDRSFVPAGFQLHSWLAPMLDCYEAKLPGEILAFWRGDELRGLFTLKPGRGLVRRSWTSPMNFSGTPLISQTAPDAVLQAFLRSQRKKVVLLSGVPTSGPFWDMLTRTTQETGGAIEFIERWDRAALLPKTTFEQWFNANFERKRRKEYRRLRARLGEEGKLEHLAWSPGDPIDPWVDDLLAVEATGWKGRRGTALAMDEGMADAFRQAIHLLAAEGSLRLWKIVFDGKPIAALSGMVKGPEGWLLKIAYDEAYAKYSPGVMVILQATETLLDKERLRLVDSCAVPNHPMINNIWRERVAFGDVMIKGEAVSALAFKAATAAEKGRRQARAAAKSLYYRITRRRVT